MKNYLFLMRINNPNGLFLLLHSTLSAFFLASNSISLNLLVLLILGAFFSRSLGCIINDFVDRKLDGFVQRTKKRPFVTKKVKKKKFFYYSFFFLPHVF